MNRSLNNQKSVSLSKRLSFFAACVYIVSLLIINIGNYVLPHICFAIWLFISLLLGRNQLISIFSRSYFKYLYIFLLYYFLASLYAFSPITCVNRLITTFELISPFIMYELYSNMGRKYSLFLVCLIIAVLLVDINIMYSTIVASAGLGLKQHLGDNDYLDNAFNLIYSMAIIPGFLVYQIRLVLNHNYRFKYSIICFSVALILISIYIVTLSLYATALFIMILGILLGFFYNRRKWKVKLLFTVCSILVLFYYLFPTILSFVSEIIPDSKILVIRIEEVFNIINGQADSEASSSARFVRAFMSLNTFFEYPFFGVTHLTSDFEKLEGVILGNHTQWIDDMALYGIFSFSLFSFWAKAIKNLNVQINIMVIIIPFVILGFLNQCVFVIQMYIYFLFMPFIGNLIRNYKNK